MQAAAKFLASDIEGIGTRRKKVIWDVSYGLYPSQYLLTTIRTLSTSTLELLQCTRLGRHLRYHNFWKSVKRDVFNGPGHFSVCTLWRNSCDLKEVIDSQLEGQCL